MTVSLYVASIPGVMQQFGLTSETLAIAPISFAALGFFLGPILAGSISEVYGRRWVFIVAIPGAVAFTIAAGTAQHFRTLVVCRTLASIFISPTIAVSVGVINDLWEAQTDRLGTIMLVLLASGVIWSTEIGPAASSFIVVDTNDWRWTFYLATILLGVCLVTLLNPETYAPELARQRAKREGKAVESRGSTIQILGTSMGRALHMIAVEPIVTTTTIMGGVYQATLYCFYIAFPLAFAQTYHFTEYQIGLTFLSLLIGSVIGVPVMMVIDKVLYRPAVAAAEAAGRSVMPEKRLFIAMAGSVLMPGSLFWLGWTTRASIHWAAPLAACIPLGISMECILVSRAILCR
jgi:MFS family permease